MSTMHGHMDTKECIQFSQADRCMKLKFVPTFVSMIEIEHFLYTTCHIPLSLYGLKLKNLGLFQDQQDLMTLLQNQQGFQSLELQIQLLSPPWLVHWVEVAMQLLRQQLTLLHRIQRFLSSFCGKMNPEESHLPFTRRLRQRSTL
jgi:hypothetical protein